MPQLLYTITHMDHRRVLGLFLGDVGDAGFTARVFFGLRHG